MDGFEGQLSAQLLPRLSGRWGSPRRPTKQANEQLAGKA